MPAQVPHTGRPSDTHRFSRGKTPHLSPISAMAVLSPPEHEYIRDRYAEEEYGVKAVVVVSLAVKNCCVRVAVCKIWLIV